MQASEMKRLAEGLLGVALAAARVQMSYFSSGVAVERKADHSPVTAADRESEEIILEGLARLAPGVPVIAEEEVTAGRIPGIGGAFFLVDPLDGTRASSRAGRRSRSTSRLIEERRPVFGLVYAPALADFYVTLGPARRRTPTSSRRPAPRTLAEAGLKPIRTRVPDRNALAALASQSHLTRATERFLDGYNVIERRALASSLKFGLIAKGRGRPLSPRRPDQRMGHGRGPCRAGGGRRAVTRLDGAPLLYGNARAQVR